MSWWKRLWTTGELERELDSELRYHFERKVAEHVAAGKSEAEARRLARLEFGGLEQVKEECRDTRGTRWIEDAIQDVRYAWRGVRRSPGFTGVAVLTLALGIGANTAIFSVVNGVLLKPLPYPEADRLVMLWERSPRGMGQQPVSPPNFADWREQQRVFETIAFFTDAGRYNLVTAEGVEKARCAYVESAVFTALSAKPLFGRTFLPEEDQRQGNRAAILSYGLWQRRFGGSSNVLGQVLTVDTYGRRDYTIVGVMPPGFGFPDRTELWLPAGWNGLPTDRRSGHWLSVLARLKPGVTLEQARAEMNTLQRRITQQHPEALIGSEVAVVPLLDHVLGPNLASALLVLWGVVAGVLLIACANVANLLLARAAARQKEIAVRVALGARGGRLARQLLTEGLLLSLLGGALGVLLASWGLRPLVAAGGSHVPRLEEVTLDAGALLFTIAVSLLTGVGFGLAPAWQLSRPNLQEFSHTRTASAGRRAGFLRNTLVVGEVALSLVLLIGAGLMLRSFARLALLERGFEAEHLLTVELDFSVSGFTTWIRPTGTRPQVNLRELMERLRHQPGVLAVGAASGLPRRARPPTQAIVIAGRPPRTADDLPTADFTGVSPDYFPAMGILLRRGRYFTEADQLGAPRVLIINETLARQHFPNEDPLGKRLAMGSRDNPARPGDSDPSSPSSWPEIVGVVADVKTLTSTPEVYPQVYVPYWQWPMQTPTVVVRTAGDPAALAAAVRNEVQAASARLPAPVIRTMDELIADTVTQPRFQSWLLSLFGLLALVLAGVGLYGVLAYAVAQRTNEIGIRMALGAERHNVLALVIRQGMKLALAGVGVGLVAALALTRVMRRLLYETDATDPVTFAGVAVLLVGIALMACYVPARRAAKVDPVIALRHE